MTPGWGAASKRGGELDTGIAISDQASTRAFFDIVLGDETIGADLTQVHGKGTKRVTERAQCEPGEASAATAWVHRGNGARKTRLQVASGPEPVCGIALLLPRAAAVTLLTDRTPPSLVILPIGINTAIPLWLLTIMNLHRHQDAARTLETRFGGRPLEELPIPGCAEADSAGWHGSTFIEVTGQPCHADDVLDG